MKKIAIIDLGSNSVRMNIYHINEQGGYSLSEQLKEMVRLAKGMGTDLILKKTQIEKTIQTLKFFKSVIEESSVSEAYYFATAALRQAKNQAEVIEQIANEVGIEFDILDGQEEAYLDYLGAINTIEKNRAIIVDVGGASTEIIKVDHRRMSDAISLPMGSVNLSERYKHSRQADKYFATHLDQLSFVHRGYDVIGLGGVIRTLGKIHKAQNKAYLEDLHHYEISNKDALDLIDKMMNMDHKALQRLDGLSSKRVDIIKSGLVPVKHVLQMTGGNLTICAYGIREGFLFKEILFKNAQPVLASALEHSIENICKKYSVSTEHADRVRFFTKKLTEGFQQKLTITENEMKLLDIASRVHYIGMHVNYYNHHIHGMHIMLVERIAGLTSREQFSVAYLIANHRRLDLPVFFDSYKHYIGNEGILRLKRLSIILKIAEQMDKGESGKISDLKVAFNNGTCSITLESSSQVETSIRSVLQYKDLFKKHEKKNLVIIHKGNTYK
ncbi:MULTISPECIES: Ppx/GppA phosphatase family protein [unclassified Fusibacter]|uniref:Ppx/GppA phosphatase family protein n=1 Tax=unclassified Fusibacter TaxID=2624464 RepID=UPI0013E98524|nr:MULTISPECIES: Ppx/GppA phosphatase family protein [unclassified Fusibacter]MCK8058389.1 Ppx/GppA family phosphatase [Fusibacter sp. A2]NPE20972.1 Ppx/GppA family phosphatase [Fusibacter sp. A1]